MKQSNQTSKNAQIVTLLKCQKGATIDDLTKSTGWQPHSIRAALSGLRKQGHAIERDKRGKASCYRIVSTES